MRQIDWLAPGMNNTPHFMPRATTGDREEPGHTAGTCGLK
jgi:hypothetical protein